MSIVTAQHKHHEAVEVSEEGLYTGRHSHITTPQTSNESCDVIIYIR